MSNASDFIIENGVLTEYIGNDGIVKVPNGVTEIGHGAFYEAGKITRVVLPEGLTKIGPEAFSKCRKLEEIVFPNGLKEIGYNAFYRCKKIKSVEIPGSCESTGYGSFMGCSGLETLVLHEGVSMIEYCSFADCTSLSKIQWPNSLRIIHSETFSGCRSLTEVVLPDGVEQLLSSAFGGCSSVCNIKLPQVILDSIDAKWFRSRFNNVDLNFLWLNGQTNFDARIGDLCTKSILRKKDEYASVIISKNSPIAMSNFLSCLKNISIETIDKYIDACSEANAAETCAVLIDYKNNKFTAADIEQIEEEHFEKELGLREYTVADWRNIFRFSNKDGKVIISEYKGTDTEITIPAKIGKSPVGSVSISYYQRWRHINIELCKKITKVTMEQGVEHIGQFGFANCSALEEMIIPDGMITIGKYAFKYCTKLASIKIPESVTFIGTDALQGCPNLTIHAPAGSYAETYAKENNIPFVAE